jgi:hypothetical protein
MYNKNLHLTKTAGVKIGGFCQVQWPALFAGEI